MKYEYETCEICQERAPLFGFKTCDSCTPELLDLGFIDESDYNGRLGRYQIHTNFIFCPSLAHLDCIEIGELLGRHKVVRGTATRHEFRRCYFYFRSRQQAESFVRRFNEFMGRREAVRQEWGLRKVEE